MSRTIVALCLALAGGCGGTPHATRPVQKVAAQRELPTAAAPEAPPPSSEAPLSAIDGLDEGVLRRWGGSKLRRTAPHALFISPDRQPIDFHFRREKGRTIFDLTQNDAMLGSVVVSTERFIRHFALSAGRDRLVTSDDEGATVWIVETGAALATNPGFSGPFAFSGSWIVGRRGRDLVAWDPVSKATRRLVSLQGELAGLSWGGPAIAALEVREVKPGRRATDHLWLFDLVADTKRTIDLGAHRTDLAFDVDPDGAHVILARGRELERVDLGASDPPEAIITLDPDPHGWGGPTLVVGRQIAAATSTDGIVLFDPWSGNVRHSIAVERPRLIALSSDGRTLAALTGLGEVLRFELPSGEEIPPPPGHSRVGAADVDPGTRRAITAGTRLELWDVEAGKRLRHAKPPRRIVEVALFGEAALTVDIEGSVDRWDLETLQASRWHAGDIESDPYERRATLLAVDAARERAAFTVNEEGRWANSQKVRVVDRDGAEIFTIDLEASALAFDDQGRLAVGHDGDVTLYDGGGKPVWRWRHTRTEGHYRSPMAVRGLALHGSLLALDVTNLEVWDRERHAIIRGVPPFSSSFAFVGTTLVVGGGQGELTSVSLEDDERRNLPPMPDHVVAIRPSARGVLIASEDGSIMVVDPSWLAPAKKEPASPHEAPQVTLVHAGDLPGAESIAVFGTYRGLSACATARGEVSCWGTNSEGELGFGDAEARATPTPLGLTRVKSLGIGHAFACALDENGRPSCWGRVDARGSADWRSPMKKPAPMAIYPGEQLHAFSSGRDGWCAIRADRSVDCRWGEVVSRVVGFSDARSIARGHRHACAIDGTGKVWCWGDNDEGQIGAGRATREGPAHAVAVEGVTEAVAIAAGTAHTCALSRTGGVSCWGAGIDGQLGDGTHASHPARPPFRASTPRPSLRAAAPPARSRARRRWPAGAPFVASASGRRMPPP
jgi:hypothetical protein